MGEPVCEGMCMRILFVAICVFFVPHVSLAQSDLETKLNEFKSKAEDFNKKAYKKALEGALKDFRKQKIYMN